MTDPIGQGAFNGLAVPLFGEAVIRQQNSSNSILSLVHSSLNTGRFVLGMDYSSYYVDQTPSSILTDVAVFDIDADGGYRGVSGTTVLFEVNSSGIYAGSTQLVELEDGIMDAPRYRATTVVSSATTALTFTSAQSGMLAIISTNTAGGDTVFVTLPATPHVGDNYEVFCNTSAASHVITKTAATGDAQGFLTYVSTGDFLTTASVTCASSGPMYFRFTALTSGSLWAVATVGLYNNTTNSMGQASAGSTSS